MKTASPVEHCAAQQWCSGWPTVSADESGSATSYTWVPDRVSRLLSNNESRYVAPDGDKSSTSFYNDNNVIIRNQSSNKLLTNQQQMAKQQFTVTNVSTYNGNAGQQSKNIQKLEMWANAQRDGRPAEYRWRPLFNAAKFGWRPLLDAVQ